MRSFIAAVLLLTSSVACQKSSSPDAETVETTPGAEAGETAPDAESNNFSTESEGGPEPPKIFNIIDRQTFELDFAANILLFKHDFNGDGLLDLVYGGVSFSSWEANPITILINRGEGNFANETLTYFSHQKHSIYPIGVDGDFNGDGIIDFAIFDVGDLSGPGNSEGGVPHLFLSSGPGKWEYSNALSQANLGAGSQCWPGDCLATIHLKDVTVGDIDNDGHLDFYVESGGGHNNLAPHFIINQGNGGFVSDITDSRRNNTIIWGPNGGWRYASHRLQDLNGDGFVDLVMGQLRRIDNNQDELKNKVVFNDGQGQFTQDNVLELPHVEWNEGWTYVKNQLIADFNGDGLLDILFSHERGNLQPDPDSLGNTGRKFQFLIQNQQGGFEDKTNEYFINHPAQLSARFSTPKILRLHDLNQDGLWTY